MTRRRVAVTSVGVASPIGDGYPRFARALLDGACAVAPIRAFDARTFPATVAAEAELTDGEVDRVADAHGIDRLAVRVDRKLCLAVRALAEVVAKLDAAARPALSLGLGLEVLLLDDVARFYDPDLRDLDPARIPRARTNPLRLSLDPIVRALRGEVRAAPLTQCFVSACASGAQAIAEGAAWVARGRAEQAVAGAADSMVNPMGVGCFGLLGALSPRSAADACRPFHAARDGTAIGEGAAFFLLEPLERARARGATVLAEVLGAGASLDAHRVTAPHPDGAGARRAMARALEVAGRPRLGYVNAHGTGTPANDPVEVAAIRAVCGDVPVASSKGQLGHGMAAAGALELAATLACFTHRRCAPTAHLDRVDAACAADHVTAARPFGGQAALSNSFGFGGQNVSVVLGAPP